MDELTTTIRCSRCEALFERDAVNCTNCGWSMEGDISGLPMPLNQKKVLFRDLIILQLKLFLDGAKDLVLMPLSIGAFLFDILPFSRGHTGRNFYAVLRAGERFDLWLNLYDASKRSEARSDGLFGESLAGANNLIGKVEQVMRNTVEVGKDTIGQSRDRTTERDGEKTRD